MKTPWSLFVAVFFTLVFTPTAVVANDGVQLADRLQRHHDTPPARPDPVPERGDTRSRGQAPEHAGERGRPEHSHEPGRPEHSRQDRSRDTRSERAPRSSNQPENHPEDDSPWSTHGAPEPETDDGEHEDPDAGRIYFERYP